MTNWEVKKNKLNIEPDEVHIWKAKIPYYLFDGIDINCYKNRNYIRNSNKILDTFRKIVDEEEYKLSLRFYKVTDQIRSISTRYILKKIISGYLNLNPTLIQFSYNDFSKPFICEAINPISLQFNISHAGEYIVFAFARNSQIGVDIELHDYCLDKQSLEHHVFSEQELFKWQTLSEQEKLVSFYHVWSCKEAILKGIGTGLSYLPNNVSVEIDPNMKPILFHLKNCKYENDFSSWSLCKFDIQNNYSAIYAIRKKEYKTTYYGWNWDDFLFINLP